jgi:hypothetical protein
MGIIAKATGDGQSFDPAPAGVHQAVCVDVIDKGLQDVPGFNGGPAKKKHMISIAWQINERRQDGKRFVIYRRYALSLNEKASLRKDLESWRGRPFTHDEEMGFDLDNLLGVNCLLNVQHTARDGRTYANVSSVMPLMRGMAKLYPLDYARESASDGSQAPTVEPENATVTAPQTTETGFEPLTDDDIPF